MRPSPSMQKPIPFKIILPAGVELDPVTLMIVGGVLGTGRTTKTREFNKTYLRKVPLKPAVPLEGKTFHWAVELRDTTDGETYQLRDRKRRLFEREEDATASFAHWKEQLDREMPAVEREEVENVHRSLSGPEQALAQARWKLIEKFHPKTVVLLKEYAAAKTEEDRAALAQKIHLQWALEIIRLGGEDPGHGPCGLRELYNAMEAGKNRIKTSTQTRLAAYELCLNWFTNGYDKLDGGAIEAALRAKKINLPATHVLKLMRDLKLPRTSVSTK